MDIRVDNNLVLIFDLDDTLYKEVDYVYSAFSEIVKEHGQEDEAFVMKLIKVLRIGGNVYLKLAEKFGADCISLEMFLTKYRSHFPKIALDESARLFLDKIEQLKLLTGLITDGRSVTQRNKLSALGLSGFFNHIVISQEFGSSKPDIRNYLAIQDRFPEGRFIYIADNPKKDFIAPNKLGWDTIMIKDNGNNIHRQNLQGLDEESFPLHIVSSFEDIVFR